MRSAPGHRASAQRTVRKKITLIVPSSAGATQAALGSHHDGDETKGSVYLFVLDYIEAREASGSVHTAGPKDLTVTPLGEGSATVISHETCSRQHLSEAIAKALSYVGIDTAQSKFPASASEGVRCRKIESAP